MPSIQDQQNTNFMEERAVNQQLAFPESDLILSSAISDEMADGFWSIKNQLMKPVLLTSFQWQTTDAAGTDLYNAFFPSVLTSKESLIKQTLSLYAFYRMSFTLRVQVNATQFNAGQLIIVFDPFSISRTTPPKETDYDYDYLSIYSATGLPHVKVQASESDPVELKIPFIHPKNFLTTNSPDAYNNLGRFHIMVLNPLTIPSGAQNNVTVSVWLYAEDAEVNVPIGFHTPVLEPTSGILPKIGESLGSSVGGKKGAKLGKNLGKVGNLLTGNMGQTMDLVGGLASGLKDMLLDYPTDPIAPLNTIAPLETLAQSKGKSRSSRLALDPYSLHRADDQAIGEDLESMDLKSIVSRPMLISQFPFSSTDAAGALLYALPIHPCVQPTVFRYFDTESVNTHNQRQGTYLSHVSNAFTYWSGGINFDVEIVATRFHTGKLLFAFVPNRDFRGDPPTLEYVSSNCPNVTIDIQQTSHFTFTVPYNAGTSMKSTLLLVDENIQLSDVSTGILVCFVLNHLNYPTNVAPQIDINLYQYAASDFNLYVPRKALWNTYKPPPPTLEATSGISIISDGNKPSSTTVTLSKDQSLSIPRPHFGEEYTLIDYIRRFSFLQSNILTVDKFAIQTLGVRPDYTNFLSVSSLSYFSKIYSAWCGSIRYKIATHSTRISTVALTVLHSPDDNVYNHVVKFQKDPNLAQGFAAVRTTLSQNNAIEVEVPYYSRYNMLITRNTISSPSVYPPQYYHNGDLVIFYSSPDQDEVVLEDIYCAAGEDFRFIFLRPPPLNNSDPELYSVYQQP